MVTPPNLIEGRGPAVDKTTKVRQAATSTRESRVPVNADQKAESLRSGKPTIITLRRLDVI